MITFIKHKTTNQALDDSKMSYINELQFTHK